jgi:hypothetical protein
MMASRSDPTNGPPAEPRWIELRDTSGKLWARYDPVRRVLHLRGRRKTVTFDLTLYGSEASG